MNRIICGFSGTLKSTIIDMEWNDCIKINSPTKFMSEFNKYYCDYWLEMHSMHMIGIRLFSLSQLPEKDNLVIERSIFDYVFFGMLMKVDGFSKESDYELPKLIELEESIIGKSIYYLIENRASNFIKNKVINSHFTRNSIYKNIDEYLTIQDKYLNFIRTHIPNRYEVVLTDELVNDILNGYSGIDWKEVIG